MADEIDWPPQVKIASSMFHPDSPSRSGGQTLSGQERIVLSDAGRWRATVKAFVRGETSVLAYRSLVAQLAGRYGTLRVPIPRSYLPRDLNGVMFSPCDQIEWESGESFQNLSMFGQASSETSYVEVVEDADIGDTELQINPVAVTFQPGHYFGLGDRLYLVQTIWESSGDTFCRFWPRLRLAAVAEEHLIIDRPLCLMRLAKDESGELELDLGRMAFTNMEFVEAV